MIAIQPHKTKPEVQVVDMDQTLTEVREENQVIVHCRISSAPGFLIRIWRSTYLHPNGTTTKIPLVHAENISYAPVWTEIKDFGVFSFTLIFNGLPKSCSSFDLIEDITDEFGAFSVYGIERNETDVYSVWL